MCKFFISGLSLSYKVKSTKSLPSGPVLYAAFGLRKINSECSIITTVSLQDKEEYLAYIRSHKLQEKNISFIERPQLTWTGEPIQGPLGYGLISDNPSLWFNYKGLSESKNSFLFLANNDPIHNLKLIDVINPCFSTMDLYSQWIASRQEVLISLLKKVDVIFGTDKEFNLIPLPIFKNLIENSNKILIIKKGKNGIEIHNNRKVIKLEAPTINQINCDIGAGDLLFGELSACIASAYINKQNLFEQVTIAYENLKPKLNLLLNSSTPDEFLKKIQYD